MKKQIIAAAVAASVSAVALADISITGATKVNYTYTDVDNGTSSNGFKNETDLAITGKSGDTTVVMKLAMDEGQSTSNGSNVTTTSTTAVTAASATTGITTNAISSSDGTNTVLAVVTDAGHTHTLTQTSNVGNSLALEDVYLTTKLGDINLKVGDWDNGDMPLRASSRGRNKVQVGTNVGGLGLTWVSGAQQGDEVAVSADIAGVKLGYKKKEAKAADYSLKASVAGFDISHVALTSNTANKDRTLTELSTNAGGIGIKVGVAEADSGATITGDSWMGDYEANTGAYELLAGMDVTAVELSTSMDGNKVTFRHAAMDKDTASTSDRSFNKVIVTRPLANGTTFEATYTDTSFDGDTAKSNQSLDLELAVKF